MRLTFLILIALTCLTACSKFRMTRDYLLTHKWLLTYTTINVPDTLSSLLDNGTILNIGAGTVF